MGAGVLRIKKKGQDLEGEILPDIPRVKSQKLFQILMRGEWENWVDLESMVRGCG